MDIEGIREIIEESQKEASIPELKEIEEILKSIEEVDETKITIINWNTCE